MTTGPMDCNELVELVTAYLDGSLDLEDRARFDLHLLECDGCENYLQQFRSTVATGVPGYTRQFLRSFRLGASQRRQVQPLDLQFDRLPGVERLRREIWSGLYDTAVARTAVAAAIDTGPLGAALGIATNDSASDAVTKVDLPVLRTLVQDHLQPNGSITMPAGALKQRITETGRTDTRKGKLYTSVVELCPALAIGSPPNSEKGICNARE